MEGHLPKSWICVNVGSALPETLTYNFSIVGVPTVIANGPPAAVVQNLHTTRITTIQFNVTGRVETNTALRKSLVKTKGNLLYSLRLQLQR